MRNLPPLHTIYNKAIDESRSDKLYYFNANHLGSGSLITDGNGQTYQILAYCPYGESLINIKKAGNYDEPYRFTGYEKDGESGLNYASARYYDENTGFISVDPLAEKYAFISGYAYCSNNPIMRIDPTGNEDIVVVGNQGKSPHSTKETKKQRHFLEAAYNYALGLKNNQETTTMLVYEGQYTNEQIKHYKSLCETNGINFMTVNDDADVADYVNKKSTFATTSNRGADKVTDFAYFGHGFPNSMALGYNTFWDLSERLSAGSLNKSAFSENANIYLASCRSGLGSLFDTFLTYTNGTVTGYNVRVQWGEKPNGKNIQTGLGYYFAWPRDPDNPKKIVPSNQRIRQEKGHRK
jgi:RHS repeat-associated protein